MGGVDYAILAVIAVSALVGILRGFVKEALSLVVWIAAFWLSYTWAGVFEVYFSELISDQRVRWAITFILLFISIHIFGFLVSRLMSKLVKSIGLSGVDRVAGGGFGLVRGIILIAVAVFVVGMTPVSKDEAWQRSFMVAKFNDGLAWVQVNYPQEFSETLAQTSD